MIIVKSKFCFVHIPKTSGSSFTKIISKHIQPNKPTLKRGRGWQGTWHSLGGQHAAINSLTKNQIDDIKDLDIITRARNPYSRILSMYFNFGLKKHFNNFNNFILHIYNNRPRGVPYTSQMHYLQNVYDLNIKKYKFESDPHLNICMDYDIEHKEAHELNRSYDKSLKNHFNKKSILMINEIYKQDFDHLDYEMVCDVADLAQ
jgi:hypothetical protein